MYHLSLIDGIIYKNKKEAIIIQVPTINPKIPNCPYFGANFSLKRLPFSFLTGFVNKMYLLIKLKPNIWPKTISILFPANNIIHQIGYKVSPFICSKVEITLQTPPRQKMNPIQP